MKKEKKKWVSPQNLLIWKNINYWHIYKENSIADYHYDAEKQTPLPKVLASKQTENKILKIFLKFYLPIKTT